MAIRTRLVTGSLKVPWARTAIIDTAFAVGLCFLIGACTAPYERPALIDEEQLRARATTKIADDIRVSATIPSEDESRSIFGVDLRQHGIQPFWLEIENGTDRQFVFLPTGLDPEYFDPLEVAYLYEDSLTDEDYEELAEHIISVSFDSRRRIRPGETVSGFVYLYRFHSSVMAAIDLLGRNWSAKISLLVPVQGFDQPQERVKALEGLYADDQIIEIGKVPELRTALEELPCCVSSETGDRQSSPLNMVLIGEIQDVAPAFGRRLYRYSPVVPSYVFGRVADLSGQKVSRWVAPQPHTIKIWLTPLRFQGKSVWIGQVTARLGGRFGQPTDVSRRIEPEVDEARNDLVQDLFYSQTVTRVGFVKGAKCPEAAVMDHAANDQACYTDGLRAVMVFGADETPLARIDTFDWESLIDPSPKPGG